MLATWTVGFRQVRRLDEAGFSGDRPYNGAPGGLALRPVQAECAARAADRTRLRPCFGWQPDESRASPGRTRGASCGGGVVMLSL
jgi:hypothetical protein